MRFGSNFIWGILLLVTGVIFLLGNFDLIDTQYIITTYWPVILIIFGIGLLLERKENKRRQRSGERDTSSIFETDNLSESGFLGDIAVKVKSENFRGGSISGVIGDIFLDISEVIPDMGEQVIRINGVVGDATVKVNRDENLSVSGSTLIGEIEIIDLKKDGIGQSGKFKSSGYDNAERKIRIEINNVIGDIQVR